MFIELTATETDEYDEIVNMFVNVDSIKLVRAHKKLRSQSQDGEIISMEDGCAISLKPGAGELSWLFVREDYNTVKSKINRKSIEELEQ